MFLNIVFAINRRDNIINSGAFILLCIWFLLPKFQVATGKAFLFFILIAWVLSTNWIHLMQSIIRNIWFFAWYIYMALLLMLGVWEYGLITPITFFVDVPLFFLGAIIFNYYYTRKNLTLLAKGCIVSLFSILIGSIISLVSLTTYPSASRELATGSIETRMYLSMGIGGYGYVYGSIMILISLIYLLRTKNQISMKMKIFFLLVYTISFIFIIKASYAIAIMMAISLSLLSLIFYKKSRWLIPKLVILGLMAMLLKDKIGYILIYLANQLPKGQANSKIIDLAEGLIANNYGQESVYRLQLYMRSFYTFLHSPFWGQVLSNANHSIGNHSTWLDLLGAFGLIGSVPVFIFFYLKFKQNIKLWKLNTYVNYLVLIHLYVILLGLINKILFVYEFGFLIFLVVPSIPYTLIIVKQK